MARRPPSLVLTHPQRQRLLALGTTTPAARVVGTQGGAVIVALPDKRRVAVTATGRARPVPTPLNSAA